MSDKLTSTSLAANSAAIVKLLLACCPTAVVGFVVAVVVDPVNAQLQRWPLAHVGQEILERTSPAITHSDSASTVVSELRMVGASATFDHRMPRGVADRVRFAVDGSAVRHVFAAEATATCGRALQQIVAIDNHLVPVTLANAPPERAAAIILPSEGDDSQRSKDFSSQVTSAAKSGHARIGISHHILSNECGWLEPIGVSASIRLASFYHKESEVSHRY